ncbi:hypothetical protein M406DRAFT_75455 [Cryphonectria parasitica EP155]|uniref:Uncharacterized protein n=1 Tax=Cryphonectria parasitica (strain ATCC 38755 / EP155) TaxID=660469 RepID=A0A9P4XQW9_CRYP1|nr:uncharacterized protein M406DRAFT_75455 [Cryphonectria parasitica EP155]KAF3760104.1 hypothetical protein M406DRAFT_75455 [Cryphonectria parasitica EP155]
MLAKSAREARKAASRHAAEKRAAERAAAKAAAATKARASASPVIIDSDDKGDDAREAENPEIVEITTPAEVHINWHYPVHRCAQFRRISPSEMLTKRITMRRSNSTVRGNQIHCNEMMSNDFQSAAQQISDILLNRKNLYCLIIIYTFNLEISSSRYIPHALLRELPSIAIEAGASEFDDLFTPASTTIRALQMPGTARPHSKALSMHKQINAEIAS